MPLSRRSAGVADAAVIGVPDPDTGERVCAVVVPDGPPPDSAVLCELLLARGLNKRQLRDRFGS